MTHDQARAAPLRYSAPSTARFLILVVALMSAAAFVGLYVHDSSPQGDEWLRVVAQCDGSAAALAESDRQRTLEACRAPVEWVRAASSIAGAATALAGGVLVAVAAPLVIQRRRRLRRLPARLGVAQNRVAELAASTGVSKAPLVMIGGSAQRDAFSYGLPGRYRIALPPKLALRSTDHSLFDPVIRHELAHISRHDVAFAWLARGVWFAVLPLVAVPIVLAVAGADFSILPDFIWRVAAILIIVRLVANEVLRVREHEADVTAAAEPRLRTQLLALMDEIQRGANATLRELPDNAQTPGTGLSRFWRALNAQHPSAQRRVQVVEDPTVMLQPTVVDGFSAALLAATAQPLIQSLLITALTGTGILGLAALVAAIATGLLLGASVGVALWRALLYCRITGRPVVVARVAIAVGTGLALGSVLSFSRVGIPTASVGTSLGILVMWLVAGIGSTALVAGIGMLWADAAPRVPTARHHRVVAVGVSTLVFALAMWAAALTTGVVVSSDWNFVISALLGAEPRSAVLIGALALVTVVVVPMILSRAGMPTPPWAVEDGTKTPWAMTARVRLTSALLIGAGAGAGGCLVIIGYRAFAGAVTTDEELVTSAFDAVLVAAVAALAAMMVLALAWGVRGAAAALAAIPVAITVVCLCFVAYSTAVAGTPSWGFAPTFLAVALSVSYLSAAHFAALGLASHRATSSPVPRWGTALAWLLTLMVAALLSIPIMVWHLSETPAVAVNEADPSISEQTYLLAVAPALAEGFAILDATIETIQAEPLTDPAARAQDVREQLLPILSHLQDTASEYVATTPELREIHGDALAAIDKLTAGFEAYAEAVVRQDATALGAASDIINDGASHELAWIHGVTALHNR